MLKARPSSLELSTVASSGMSMASFDIYALNYQHVGAQEDYSDGFSASVAGPSFASADNLEHCQRFINQSLAAFGYPSSLCFNGLVQDDAVLVCNCIYALLTQRQKDLQFRSTNEEQQRKLFGEISLMENKVDRLERSLELKDRELGSSYIKERQMAAVHKAALDKLILERDELQKAFTGIQHRQTQQLHEIRKKEREYTKLQEKLNQILVEKRKESKASMEIINLLKREGHQRGRWFGTKQTPDADLYKTVVDAYEAKQKELVQENADLRNALRTLQDEMKELINSHKGPTPSKSPYSREHYSPAIAHGADQDEHDSPVGDLEHQQLVMDIRAKICSLKERINSMSQDHWVAGGDESLPASPNPASPTRMAPPPPDMQQNIELERQLHNAYSIIAEQEALIQQVFESAFTDTDLGNTTADGLSPTSVLQQKRSVLEERLHAIQRERIRTQEEANRLDSEREALQRQKRLLEEESESFHSAMKAWAPGLGAGHFLAKAIRQTSSQDITRTLLLRPVSPENVEQDASLQTSRAQSQSQSKAQSMEDALLPSEVECLRSVFASVCQPGVEYVNTKELLLALQCDPQVGRLLQLPARVQQNGVTRDTFSTVFSDIAGSGNGFITWREFLHYFAG